MKQLKEPKINIDSKLRKEEVKQVDQADESIIRYEIDSGRTSSQYVYYGKDGSAKLGIAGINHLARERGGFLTPISGLNILEGKNHWDITIEAVDSRKNSSAIGTFIQNKFDEHGNADPYAKQICLSKARRNALTQLIDDEDKEDLIKKDKLRREKEEKQKNTRAKKEVKKVLKKAKPKPVKKKVKKQPEKAVAPKSNKAVKPVEPELFEKK